MANKLKLHQLELGVTYYKPTIYYGKRYEDHQSFLKIPRTGSRYNNCFHGKVEEFTLKKYDDGFVLKQKDYKFADIFNDEKDLKSNSKYHEYSNFYKKKKDAIKYGIKECLGREIEEKKTRIEELQADIDLLQKGYNEFSEKNNDK